MRPLKLTHKQKVDLFPTSPFYFDATFHKPDHFTSGDNLWEKGIRWQTWKLRNPSLGLKVKNVGSVKKPKIELEIFSDRKLTDSEIHEIKNEVEYSYNLNLDLTEFYKKFEADPKIGPVIKRMYGMRPGHPSSLYEYLIIGVVLQNATVRRSVQMFRTLLETYGGEFEFDGKKLWCFWEPGKFLDVPEEGLRALKLGYRTKFIKKIDEQFAQGSINESELQQQDRETQMKELLKLYGVGPATVWYILFDVFHHWDFFNHVSPWEQKIYSKIFFDKDPTDPVPVTKILKYFEKFGEYKQLVVHYVWEDLWWRRKNGEKLEWLEKEIRT